MLSRKLRTAVAGQTVATPSDPNFNQTVLLLHGDGTNGGQNNTFLDNKSSSPGDPVDWYGTFDGSSQQLSLTNNAAFQFGTGDFTVEFYMYPTSWTIYQRVIALGGYASAGNFQVEVTSSGAVLYVHINGGLVGFNTSFSLNTWYHVAVVRSSGTVTVYVNGSSVGTSSQSGTVNSTSALYIGSEGGANYFAGRLSNVRLVKGTAVYTANFTPFKGTLTAVSGTSLLTVQSSTIVDNSPNAFAITNTGTVTMTQIPGTGPAVFTITRNGNTTQGTFSPFSVADGNWSNYFDGTGDTLTAPFSSANFDFGTGDFTIEAWMYQTVPFVAETYRLIWGNYNGANNSRIVMGFNGDKFGIFFNSMGIETPINSGFFVPNTWIHVAVTRQSSTVRIFVNGVLRQTGSTSVDFNAGNDCIVGANWLGYLSNVRVVKGTAVYTAAFTPSTTPLTAITNTTLLTCQSNRFRDASVNNLAITRNGDVTVRPFSPFAPNAAYSASTNGGSAYFDGTGDFLALPSNAAFGFGSGDFTMECWFYKTTSNLDVLIDTRIGAGGNVNGMALYVQSNTLKAGNDAERLAGGTVVSNSWNHCAVVRSGNNLNLYLNGTRTATAAFSTTLASASSPYIGNSATNEYTGGYISNARILKGTAQYTGTTYTIPTAPLTAITNTSLLCNFTNAAIIDNTGKNVLETVGNAQIDTGTKKFGTGALEFDGTDDYMTVPSSVDNLFGTGNFTFEMWVNATFTQAANAILIGNGAWAANKWAIQTNSGSGNKFYFFANNLNSTNAILTSSTTISAGIWYHLAIVRNGSSLKMYVNGIEESSTTNSNSLDGNVLSSMFLGYDGTNSSTFYKGFIDDLRITKGIARYTANFTPPTSAFLDK